MGQYFYFYNKTKELHSQVGCKNNGNLKWSYKLHMLDYRTICEIFQQIIEDNNWNYNDIVEANGDYGCKIIYDNNKVLIDDEECNEDYNNLNENDIP